MVLLLQEEVLIFLERHVLIHLQSRYQKILKQKGDNSGSYNLLQVEEDPYDHSKEDGWALEDIFLILPRDLARFSLHPRYFFGVSHNLHLHSHDYRIHKGMVDNMVVEPHSDRGRHLLLDDLGPYETLLDIGIPKVETGMMHQDPDNSHRVAAHMENLEHLDHRNLLDASASMIRGLFSAHLLVEIQRAYSSEIVVREICEFLLQMRWVTLLNSGSDPHSR